MDNYRQRPTRKQTKQAIDGILNAPVNRINRAPDMRPHEARHTVANGVRSSRQTRRIGDFTNLKEGYHSADQTEAGRLTSSKPTAHQKNTEIRKNFSTETVSYRHKPEKTKKRKEKKAKKPRAGWKKWTLRSFIILIILVVAIVGFLIAKGYLKLNDVFKGGGYSAALGDEVDISKLKSEGDGRVNILLIGGREDDDPQGGGLTDSIVIASIDPVNSKAALISVQRDFLVRIDGHGQQKINAVFKLTKNDALDDGMSEEKAQEAGAKALEQEVTEIFGINMHYYVMVDIAGFTKAVDTIGGVSITVPEELRDSSMAWQNNGRSLLVPAGQQTLDAKRSLFYVQSRYGSARGDFDRAERQRIFLTAFAKQVGTASTYSNPLTVSRLMDDFGDHMRTDFSINDMIQLYEIMRKIGDAESIGLADEPHNYITTGSSSVGSVVHPKAGLFDYTEIQAYIRSVLPDGYIVKENAPIVVLNGTSQAGVATEAADLLKSYKYNVTKVDNAPTQAYPKTVIIDLTGKNPYTKNYLEKRYGVTVTTDIPEELQLTEEEKKGFIIILGEDIN